MTTMATTMLAKRTVKMTKMTMAMVVVMMRMRATTNSLSHNR